MFILNGKKISSDKLTTLSSADACKVTFDKEFGTYHGLRLRNRPCKITSYRKTTEWESTLAAIVFFDFAAAVCDGSESERYHQIADFLILGATNVSDEEFTDDMNAAMKNI